MQFKAFYKDNDDSYELVAYMNFLLKVCSINLIEAHKGRISYYPG